MTLTRISRALCIALTAAVCPGESILGRAPSTGIQESSKSLGPVVFYEDHFTKYLNFPEGVSGFCETGYTAAGYSLRVLSGQRFCMYRLNGAGFFDSRVRIALTLTRRQGGDNAAVGLVFGSPYRDFYHALLVTGDGRYALQTWRDGKWERLVPWTFDKNVRPGLGATNQLVVDVHGRSIRASINGAHVSTTPTDGDIRGEVGIFLDNAAEIVLSHLRVDDASNYERPPWTTVEVEVSDSILRQTEARIDRTGCQGSYSEGGYTLRLIVLPDQPQPSCLRNLTFKTKKVPESDHFRIDVTARLREGGSGARYGLAFGWPPGAAIADAFYVLYVTGAGEAGLTYITRTSHRDVLPPRQDVLIRRDGGPNVLSVEAYGNNIRGYVNGAYVGTVPTTGPVWKGFGFVSGGSGMRARVNDVVSATFSDVLYREFYH